MAAAGCQELALLIYENTLSLREAQQDLAEALEWIVDCNMNGGANGGASYGHPDFCSPFGVLLALAAVEYYQFVLEDLAGVYGSHGCWGPWQ